MDVRKVSESRSAASNSLQPHRLYSPWNSPGQNTGVGSLSLLQGIFPTQGSNPGLPWQLDHNKAECWRMDTSELWCWRRLLRVLWTAMRSDQSFLKEISPDYSLEGVMLKLKLQYFGHLMQRADWLQRPWCWVRLRSGEGDSREWDGWLASPTQWT